jgi:hypothetical protein
VTLLRRLCFLLFWSRLLTDQLILHCLINDLLLRSAHLGLFIPISSCILHCISIHFVSSDVLHEYWGNLVDHEHLLLLLWLRVLLYLNFFLLAVNHHLSLVPIDHYPQLNIRHQIFHKDVCCFTERADAVVINQWPWNALEAARGSTARSHWCINQDVLAYLASEGRWVDERGRLFLGDRVVLRMRGSIFKFIYWISGCSIDMTKFHYLSEDLVLVVKKLLTIYPKVSLPQVPLWNSLAIVRIKWWVRIGRALLNDMTTLKASLADIPRRWLAEHLLLITLILVWCVLVMVRSSVPSLRIVMVLWVSISVWVVLLVQDWLHVVFSQLLIPIKYCLKGLLLLDYLLLWLDLWLRLLMRLDVVLLLKMVLVLHWLG